MPKLPVLTPQKLARALEKARFEQIPGLLTRLESEGLKYELIDLTLG